MRKLFLTLTLLLMLAISSESIEASEVHCYPIQVLEWKCCYYETPPYQVCGWEATTKYTCTTDEELGIWRTGFESILSMLNF